MVARTLVGLSPSWSRHRHYDGSNTHNSWKVRLANYEQEFGERLPGKTLMVAPGLMYAIRKNVFGTLFEVFVMRVFITNDDDTTTPVLRVSDGLFGTEFLKKLKYQARKENINIEMVDHHSLFPDL